MKKDVIIALDFSSKGEVLNFLNQFKDEEVFVKIGMELFYSEGIEVIKTIKDLGHKVFLDLKLHDIPNTVKHAMKNLTQLGVDMINVHATGTSKMMKAAVEGINEGARLINKRPICIGVTILTSIDEKEMQNDMMIDKTVGEAVIQLAQNSKTSGLDGVVCSPHEVSDIHNKLGNDFITVTPGIRLKGDNVNDQNRVTTPEEAKNIGSDYIVVGRSITKSGNPYETYKLIKKQFIGV